jgi:hypothetical protein
MHLLLIRVCLLVPLLPLASCRESPQTPRFKPGAWEVVSTFSVSLEGAPSNVIEEFNSGHPEYGQPRTSRLCVSEDAEEVKLRESLSTLPHCTRTVIKQNAAERVENMVCDKPIKQ